MTQFRGAPDAASDNNYIWRLRGAVGEEEERDRGGTEGARERGPRECGARLKRRGGGDAGRKRTDINLGRASLDDPRDKCGTRRDRLNFDEPPGNVETGRLVTFSHLFIGLTRSARPRFSIERRG